MDHRGIEPHGNGIRITVQYRGRRYRRFLAKPWRLKKNRAEAQGLRDDLKYRLTNALPLDDNIEGDNPTFYEVAETYLKSLRRKPSTVQSYQQCLNRYWLPHLHDKRMLHVTFRDVLEADTANAWPSAKTRKNAVGALRGVFNTAIAVLDGVNVNLAAKLPRESLERRDVDPFTAAEKADILAALAEIDRDARDYFALAFETGLRVPGELNALCWRHYRRGKYIEVVQSIARRRFTTTKTHAARKVYLTPEAVKILEARPRALDGGYIFRNSAGGPFLDGDVYNARWRQALALASERREARGADPIRYRRAYNVRHTRATLDLMAGGKPAFLASQLGHTLDQFFSNYATWIRSNDDEAELAAIVAGRRRDDKGRSTK